MHEDIAVNYDSTAGTLTLTARDENNKREYRSDHVFHRVPVGAKLTIPNLPAYSFLGPVGASTWILPQTQNTSLLYLGFSTENKTAIAGWNAIGVTPGARYRGYSSGTFVGNTLAVSLLSVQGPGNFAVYSVNGSGTPTVYINSGNGITSDDKVPLPPISHTHYNWAFSAKGFYQITLQAQGTRSSDNAVITSPPTTFFFGVEAAPYTYANWAAGYETTYSLTPNTLASNPSNDPDGDGLTNFAEYALQWMKADPLRPNPNLLNAQINPSQVTFSYLRDSLKLGVSYAPQGSTDLTNWFNQGAVGGLAELTDTLNESRTISGTVEERLALLPITTRPRASIRLKMSP